MGFRPIEMETLRRQEDPLENDVADLNTSLLQRYVQPNLTTNNEVSYAQIIRPAAMPAQARGNDDEDRIDFRLQTPRQLTTAINDENASMSSPLMSGGSSLSSVYVEVTHPRTQAQRRVVRPTSPETSF